MKLRHFLGRNVSEALSKVKAELGDEAVILRTKNVTRKDENTGTVSTFVEVLAAVDNSSIELKSAYRENNVGVKKSSSSINARGRIIENDLIRQIKELKDQICQMSEIIKGLAQTGLTEGKERARPAYQQDNERLCQTISSCLCLDEKGYELIKKILLCVDNRQLTMSKAVSAISSFVSRGIIQGPVAERLHGKCWWAFVGPTGVGKTTTLAKIAARLRFICKKKGVFICADGYRMGAVEQLKRFAHLMDIPLEFARTNRDLVRLFGAHKDKDFIFVDTTGRNPFSSSHKTELERLFDAVPGLMAQVMLSATIKREDLMGSISFYRQFPVAGWSLTKVDETTCVASSILPVIEAELPLSYVTNGQRVPEDIEYATSGKLASMATKPLNGLGMLLGMPSNRGGNDRESLVENL